MEVPVINLEPVNLDKQFSDLDEAVMRQVGKDIVKALTEVGFLQIVNHGITDASRTEAMAFAEAFFDQPLPHKMDSLRKNMEVLGYLPTPDIAKNEGVISENFNKNTPPDPKETLHYSESLDEKRSPDRHLPGFTTAMDNLLKQQHELHRRLLIIIGYGLNLADPHCFTQGVKDLSRPTNETVIRLANYPPIPDSEPGHLRCGVHTDFGTLTFIFQNNVPGLQIADRSGNYHPVLPVGGAILVNVGDLLQLWTGGVLRSAPHRVVVDKDSQTKKRLSLIYFGITDAEFAISAVTGQKTGCYAGPVTAKSFLQRRYDDIFKKGCGLIEEDELHA